jgi:hypothetical protein
MSPIAHPSAGIDAAAPATSGDPHRGTPGTTNDRDYLSIRESERSERIFP